MENLVFNTIKELIKKNYKIVYSYTLMGNGEFLKYNLKSNSLTFKDITNKLSYINPEYFYNQNIIFRDLLNNKNMFNITKNNKEITKNNLLKIHNKLISTKIKPIKENQKINFSFNPDLKVETTKNYVLSKTKNIKLIEKILNNTLKENVINKPNTIKNNIVKINILKNKPIYINNQYFKYVKKQGIKKVYTININPAPITFLCKNGYYYTIAHIIGVNF